MAAIGDFHFRDLEMALLSQLRSKVIADSESLVYISYQSAYVTMSLSLTVSAVWTHNHFVTTTTDRLQTCTVG